MKTSDLKDEPHSILVAHGAEDTRIIFKTALKEAGYHHVSVAANGRQIFERLERSDYHLLITALDLPGINCWQLLRVIATGVFCSPRLPVLIVCNANQISLIEPLAQEHHAHLLASDELARLPEAVAVCINGPKKPTILVVEDHLNTAQLIELSLQTHFEVEIAPSGEEGLEADEQPVRISRLTMMKARIDQTRRRIMEASLKPVIGFSFRPEYLVIISHSASASQIE